MLLDVPGGVVDDNGNVGVWSRNATESQRWVLERVDGYYLICWNNYALTYDLDDNSIRLTPKMGGDNQLWSFTQ